METIYIKCFCIPERKVQCPSKSLPGISLSIIHLSVEIMRKEHLGVDVSRDRLGYAVIINSWLNRKGFNFYSFNRFYIAILCGSTVKALFQTIT